MTKTERHIFFKSAMVARILSGHKTHTRRRMKLLKYGHVTNLYRPNGDAWHFDGKNGQHHAINNYRMLALCPYGKVGDRLWVKETWGKIPHGLNHSEGEFTLVFKADGNLMIKWSPSIHMPRKYARILLEITNIRIEHLNDITAEDAIAEGISEQSKDGGRIFKYGLPDSDGLPGNDNHGWQWADWCDSARKAFKKLWESINGQGSFDSQYVWVIEFKRIVQ